MGSCICPKCGCSQAFGSEGCPPGHCGIRGPIMRMSIRDQDDAKPPCKYFQQGKCTRPECQYPHIDQPAPQPKKPCRNIAEGRKCPWGELCHFAH